MLIEQPDGTYAEDAPPDCEACDLAWPFDGTPGRVTVSTEVGGARIYTCGGCGHITRRSGSPPVRNEIGAAPDSGQVPRR